MQQEEYEMNPNAITFENGIVGFPDYKNWELQTIKQESHFHQFLLLQSLDNLNFGLLVYALRNPMKFYPNEAIDIQDSVVLLVTTWNKTEQMEFSSNLRSPIIINSNSRRGSQIVFHNPEYDVRSATSDIINADLTNE